MNTDQFWNSVKDKYPALRDPDHLVRLTSRGLRRLLDQAAEVAVENHIQEMQDKLPKNPFAKLFGK